MIENNTITGALYVGILTEDNWWGCPDGPTHPDCDPVTANVDDTPWLADQDPDAGSQFPPLSPIET